MSKFIYFIIILYFIFDINSKLNYLIEQTDANNISIEKNMHRNSMDLHKLSETKNTITIKAIDHKSYSYDKSIKITFYSPKLKGINSDRNPNKTALMKKPISGWTCAISRDLMNRGWLGKKIYIDGVGMRYASDLMARTYKGKKITNQIDLCVGKNDVRKQAKKLGKNIRFVCVID
jgi:hypothetical protein